MKNEKEVDEKRERRKKRREEEIEKAIKEREN